MQSAALESNKGDTKVQPKSNIWSELKEDILFHNQI
jgi:hypothetical protein